MGKLALAAGRGSELAETRASIVVDLRARDASYARIGETVLVYLHIRGAVLEFVGHGRILNAGVGPDDQHRVALEPYTAFAMPVTGDAERDIPGARRMLEVADSRFDEVMAQAVATSGIGAAEAAAGFVATPTEATYTALRDQVLRAFRHRCTFTGRSDADGPLSIVAIRPRDQGGPLHVANYLPMVPDLERAWRLGYFSVGEDYRILGDLYRLAPEDQEAMVPLFKVLLPSDAKRYADPELLAWHRLNVFGRS